MNPFQEQSYNNSWIIIWLFTIKVHRNMKIIYIFYKPMGALTLNTKNSPLEYGNQKPYRNR